MYLGRHTRGRQLLGGAEVALEHAAQSVAQEEGKGGGGEEGEGSGVPLQATWHTGSTQGFRRKASPRFRGTYQCYA